MRFAGIGFVLSLLCAGAAGAQTASVPFDRLATHGVAIQPPAQWKASAFTGDRFLIEQGELTPQDQTPMFWRDQLGYVAAPSAIGAPTASQAADQTASSCAASLTLHLGPRNAGADEDWAEVACLVSWRASDAI